MYSAGSQQNLNISPGSEHSFNAVVCLNVAYCAKFCEEPLVLPQTLSSPIRSPSQLLTEFLIFLQNTR